MNKIVSVVSQIQVGFELSIEDKIKLIDYIINSYINKYKHLYKYPKEGNIQEGLDWLHNDILKFVGIKWDLIKKNDEQSLKHWNSLNYCLIKDNYPNQDLMRDFLEKLPTKDFYAFLGYSQKSKILEMSES